MHSLSSRYPITTYGRRLLRRAGPVCPLRAALCWSHPRQSLRIHADPQPTVAGLFSQKTCLTPFFPSRWPGGDGSPMFSELPVTRHVRAGNHWLVHGPANSQHCPAPSTQHRAGPQGGPTNAQIQAEGRGCLGAQGLRGVR